MSSNIFDDDVFFEHYKTIRNKVDSYNNTMEQPAMTRLLPDVRGKSVLDMGCGFGHNCATFVKMGAARIVGIDIAEKMLNVAMGENSDERIQYLQLDMTRIDELDANFDLVYSSLALHYVEDFDGLIKKVYAALNDGGVFLFSQEHPLVTAPLGGPTWIRDEQGIKIAAPLSDYLTNGERHVSWLIDDISKYHRSFSCIANTLSDNGFAISQVVEPSPTVEVLAVAPQMYDEVHRPTAIIFKAQKL